MKLIITAVYALALGMASGQDASSFPSGSSIPSSTPSALPSSVPSTNPSSVPTLVVSTVPSVGASAAPSDGASAAPSASPSVVATPSPLPPASENVVAIVEGSAIHENFELAIKMLAESDLETSSALDTTGITVFAPTDAAFGALVAKTGRLLSDLFRDVFIRHLECFVLSHVLTGVLTENVLAQKPAVYTSLSGFDVPITTSGEVVQVAGVPVDVTNVAASNGVIHFLNTLPIIPPCVGMSIAEQVAEAPLLVTTVAKVATSAFVSGFIDAFTPITVLAPSNEAWLKLPTAVTNYLNTNATALDIVLKYHVFGGMNFFGSGTFNNTYTTLVGDKIVVSRTSGALRIRGQTDIGTGLAVSFLSVDNLAQNGVYHVIDRVLIPPSLRIPIFVICFPGEATVDVKGTGKTAMKNLKIGDEVLTSSGSYNKVYGFGHNQGDAIGEYVEISTKETSEPLQLSKDHMLFVDYGRAVPARSLKVGDEILLESGKKAGITKISNTFAVGAFAPFTESGSIVVNGVVASSYIAMDDEHGMLTLGGIELPISYQWMSHASQAPHRAYCRMFDCTDETYSADGVSEWVDSPYNAGRFLLKQNVLVQALAFFVLVPWFAVCACMAMIFDSPVTAATGLVGIYSLSSMFKLRLTPSTSQKGI